MGVAAALADDTGVEASVVAVALSDVGAEAGTAELTGALDAPPPHETVDAARSRTRPR